MNLKIFSHHVLAKIDALSNKQWIGLLAMIAGLITVRIHYVHMGWINSDSVLYLEAAKWMAAGDFRQALAIYNWPFYSICIALVAKLFHIPILLSAQILSTVFFMLSTTAFLNIVSRLGGNQRTLIIAALSLFGCDYLLGDVLPMLMRDQGYWAFFLLSVWVFIKFIEQPTWLSGGLWQMSIVIAVLFRIEGIFYLALPMIVVFEPALAWRDKLLVWLKANYLVLLGLLLLLSSLYFLPSHYLGRLLELSPQQVMQSYHAMLVKKSDLMSTQVLGRYLNEYALLIILIGFLLITFLKSIFSVGLISSALAANYVWQVKKFSLSMRALYAVMFISFISMYGIITKVFVLSGRYIISMSFMLLILASFGLAQLLHSKAHRYNKKIALIVLMIFALTAVKNLMPKPERFDFRQDAMVWLKNNNPQQEKVFFNEIRLAYYYQDQDLLDWIMLMKKAHSKIQHRAISTLNQYPFLAIYVTPGDQALYQTISQSQKFNEIARFYNHDRKKYISIFRQREPL